jgi:hypothetical protein
MFLSVTNNLCQDVAVVPFLWVLPLAIYLLSFILCFASGRWYHRTGFIVATAVASLALLKTAGQSSPFTLTTQILAHSCFLFVFCMICHGELVRLKPPPRHLTLFFLMVALGGVTGGVFVGLIAPFVFSGYWEFHVSLFAGWVVMAVILARDGMSAFHRGDRWQFAFVILLIGYPAISFALEFTPLRHVDFFWKNLLAVRVLISAIVTMFVLALCWRWPLAQSKYWPRVMVGGVICFVAYSAIQNVRGTHKQAVSARRNFYGVVRVVRDQVQVNGRLSPLLQLMHGQVNHGIQFQDDAFRQQPVGYYSKDSGIELAFRLHPRRQAGLPVNIGVLGLGAGTLAAFARAGDTIRFYEINPVVSGYSTGPRPYFTYLRDCKGRVDTVLGDARLSLQRELLANERGRFDILAMDAFSGDSVPVHLLTKEAFEIYLQHRRDKEGIIAVNISNRFLDLRALMFGLARRFGLHAVVIDCGGNPPERTPSRWCLMTKNQGFVADKLIQAAQQKEGAHGSILWTDDFSNLIQLLR